jgi:hypothetical protein
VDRVENEFLVSSELPRDGSPPQRTVRAFLLVLTLVLAYAVFLGGVCSSIAFVDPGTRRDWAPVVVGVLFPVGQSAFFLSQLIGGFLTAAVGLSVGNVGAAIPLFVAGLAVGLVHGALVVAVVRIVRWAASAVGSKRRTDV